MKRGLIIHLNVFICIIALVLTGCTREKAEAIKVAAGNFRQEASAALNQIRTILKQNIAMPPQDVDKLAVDWGKPQEYPFRRLRDQEDDGLAAVDSDWP